jgi:ribosomal protein S18 acetylase RimI-like enzyme
MTGLDDRIEIVRADPSDAAMVDSMMRRFAGHEGFAAANDERRWRELLADDRVMILVATIGSEPIGYLSAVRTLHVRSGADIVALDDVYVRPSARHRGAGEALVGALAALAALAEGAGHAIRWEVEEGNLAGQRFSLRIGARLRRKVVAWWQPEPPS